MYFPILRGKQNELLALRELLEAGKLSKEIVPIIEPVTPSGTFKKLLIQFDSNGRKIAVIQNSSIIQYENFNDEKIKEIKSKDFFIPALTIDDEKDFDFSNYTNLKKMIILNEKSEFNDFHKIDNNTYIVIELNNRLALRRFKGKSNLLVEKHDQFLKQDRNADYADKADELFSVEHIYYKDDGYCGFSDYSIIGSDYIVSGFAAKAVAIHLVYFDKQKELRVHHFVSDSNDDIKDPALKTREALEKLVKFVNSSEFDDKLNHSMALDKFEELYQKDKYSGLGFLKKLSIEHHLEIMGRYLDNN